jgi:hypothetical protein
MVLGFETGRSQLESCGCSPAAERMLLKRDIVGSSPITRLRCRGETPSAFVFHNCKVSVMSPRLGSIRIVAEVPRYVIE